MSMLLKNMLDARRKNKTIAYQLSHAFKNVGLVYIQQGMPISCEYSGLSGLQALEQIYKEEKSGIDFDFFELDGLGIYTENIKEQSFENLILSLLEKIRQNKVFKNYSFDKKTEVNYWQ